MGSSIYGNGTLPNVIRSRTIPGVNGLDVHILECGDQRSDRPLILLLHGFPDLAYGWRRLMPLLSDAGYHVVAPDLRGFGRTTGWVNSYDTPLAPFGLLNLVRDAVGLVSALGCQRTAAIVGHDLGSPVAAYCALARPDVFPAVVFMSAPFPGPPAFPAEATINTSACVRPSRGGERLAADLAALDPPREYYQQYLSSQQANADMWRPPQGLHAFLRAFFYVKSGEWPGNKPHPLKARTAVELARMPTYYVMDLGKTMPQTVAPSMPAARDIASCTWLTEAELDVYTEEYGRTGFQGALQTYRVLSDSALNDELRLFAGKTIDVPSLFIGGKSDWGTYSAPGALEAMQNKAATKMAEIKLIDGAGHWIQQEQPRRLSELLLTFLEQAVGGPAQACAIDVDVRDDDR